MNVGELFLNLGIKGTDKTIGALGNVSKGLGGVASMSLEAKAGIVAALYAMERLFAASGAQGTGLTNLNALLGMSAKELQQYNYAARQVGISNQEMEGSFKTLQTSLTNHIIGKAPIEGLAQLDRVVGGISTKFLEQAQQKPQLMLQKLQEYAAKERNIGLRNQVLRSFGVGDNMISGLVRQGFRPEVLQKAPTYGDNEIKSLDRANIAWSNLGQKIEMAVGHFNALHGQSLVDDFTILTGAVIKFAGSLALISERYKVFEKLAFVVKELGGALDDLTGYSKGKRTFWGDEIDEKTGKPKTGQPLLKGGFGNFFDWLSGGMTSQSIRPNQLMNTVPNTAKNPGIIAPPVQRAPQSTNSAPQDINVNQTFNFEHDGKDHQKTGQSVKKAVQDTFWQMSAVGQGS